MFRILTYMFRFLNRFVAWYRLPFFVSVANLLALREDLRHLNLYSTTRTKGDAGDAGDFDVRGFRTADGSHNDLSAPEMGRKGERFGRNVPLDYTYGEKEPDLLTPNPREISNKLLARRDFIPVPHLNVHAAAWLQFMTHDWFSHGPNDKEKDRRIYVPLPNGDDWSEPSPEEPGYLSVLPSTKDKATSADDGMPTAFRNTETHWWDGSQIYGSDTVRLRQVRSNPDGELVPGGKLYLDPLGHLAVEEKSEVELTGVNGNWWIGLSLMTTLFVREHNAIVDALKIEHPTHDDEWLFQKARLINAALMTKIHTVEWTPALLNFPAGRFALRGNWWGVLGEGYERSFGRDLNVEILTGIPGTGADHHSAPYSITEEFVAVYRMHGLLPDEFTFKRLSDDSEITTLGLQQVAGKLAHTIYTHTGFADAWYSLGVAHPGMLRLHNFPNSLRRLQKQGSESGRVVDVAMIDILRDRERGVPRYCDFRRLLRMSVPRNFRELTGGDLETANELASVYDHIDDVDLLVGCLAEPLPPGFGFSETAFRIFILMANRRIKSDRFYTDDFTDKVYTPTGMRWIRDNGMKSVLVRHMPELEHKVSRVKNAFFTWPRD